ncbi:MAG: hypothetical protein KGM98_01800 [Bacteroidota bacterium]|nr:hypothetical protein [Bacteroidota bacterium]
MNSFKKLLILIIIAVAMYGTYRVVEFLKARINGRKNLANFILLLLTSFGAVFLVIVLLGWIFTYYRNFFFTH